MLPRNPDFGDSLLIGKNLGNSASTGSAAAAHAYNNNIEIIHETNRYIIYNTCVSLVL